MYIIIGQGAAGASAANELRRMDPSAQITIVTEEAEYVYSRIDLPDIIAGKYPEASATLHTAEHFQTSGIECRMGQRVAAINPANKIVELTSGERLSYSKLLLATGSASVIPPIQGADVKGIHVVWTISQARSIIEASEKAKAAVVIGAGLVGIKTALALAARGLQVTVVEKLPRVLPRQLDSKASEMIAARIRAKGVELLIDASVERIEQTQEGGVSAVWASGRRISCEMVIMAIGVRPRVELAQAAGIQVKRGIVVNEFLQTSEPEIYAAGDVAEVVDALTGQPVVPAIWPEAVEQGLLAARNMAGSKASYSVRSGLNSVEVAGTPIVSVGDVEGETGDEVITFAQRDCYRKVVMRGKIVRGVLCVGDIRQAGVLANLVLRQTEIKHQEKIANPSFAFANLMA